MSCFVLLLFVVYLIFLPPYSPIDVATAVDAPLIDYVTVGSSSLSNELSGKQSPSPLPDITYLFCTILALGIVTAVVTLIPILLHNLFLSPLIVVPYLVLCCLV